MNKQSVELYELSLTTHFEQWFKDVEHLWAVMPSPKEAPNSSLTHMLSTLGAEKYAGASLPTFHAELAAASQEGTPILLFGTAFGLFELLSISPVSLAPGSRIIETGGFKGRRQDIDRNEFYLLLSKSFDVPDYDLYSEYGMCEMSSQYYSFGVSGGLTGPHWTKTRCIDPVTNEDAIAGQPGLLRHYDLANHNSVAVIQTQDRAIMSEDGSFKLIGRATDAELRGCSLTAEELWSR